MKRLRVLVLMHEELVPPDSITGLSEEQVHPFKMEFDVLRALEELGHEIRPLAVADELVPIRQAIEEWQPDIAFNLLMSFHGVGLYDAHVVSYLELLKTAYSGCNPRGLLLAGDKALSKKIFSYHRIRTPGFAVFRRGRTVLGTGKLGFPLFVKSVVEHASLGIAQASIVKDAGSLRERVEFIHRSVGTDAIAEEYIEGREFTVSVVGNERLSVFPPWELSFDSLPEGTSPIATARVKWDLKYQKKLGVRTGRARRLPEGKAEEIDRTARRVYRALGLSGFARVDLRMTAQGDLHVLEANPNPDLCRGEDLADSARAAGLDYAPLIQRLLSLGLRYSPAWKED